MLYCHLPLWKILFLPLFCCRYTEINSKCVTLIFSCLRALPCFIITSDKLSVFYYQEWRKWWHLKMMYAKPHTIVSSFIISRKHKWSEINKICVSCQLINYTGLQEIILVWTSMIFHYVILCHILQARTSILLWQEYNYIYHYYSTNSRLLLPSCFKGCRFIFLWLKLQKVIDEVLPSIYHQQTWLLIMILGW